jgi:hypothetical protein
MRVKGSEIFAAQCLFVRGHSQLIHLADEKGKKICFFFSKIAAKKYQYQTFAITTPLSDKSLPVSKSKK